MTRRLQGAFDLRLRRLVGPHRIQSDYARHGGRRTRTSLRPRSLRGPCRYPHFGQARCGIFCSWQFGHSESECLESESCARRVAVRFWECLRFGLGMCSLVLSSQLSQFSGNAGIPENRELGTENSPLLIQLISYLFQRRPARIFHLIHARALILIQILAAMRTQTLAVFAANRLQRQRQQHLLAQRIFEQQALRPRSTRFRPRRR